MGYEFYKFAVAKTKEKKDNTARNIALGVGGAALAAGGVAYAVSPEFRNSVNSAAAKTKEIATNTYNDAKPKVQSAYNAGKQKVQETNTYLFKDRAKLKGLEGGKLVERVVPTNDNLRAADGMNFLMNSPSGQMTKYRVTNMPSRFDEFTSTVGNKVREGYDSAREAITPGVNSIKGRINHQYQKARTWYTRNQPEVKKIIDENEGRLGRRSPTGA